MFLPAEFDAADVYGGINQDMDKVDNNQLATVSESPVWGRAVHLMISLQSFLVYTAAKRVRLPPSRRPCRCPCWHLRLNLFKSAELELITKSRSSKHEAVVGSGRKEANDDNDMQRQRE